MGRHNQLPWHLPADLAHFKKITMGKSVVMGRKTFESIGKPLSGRRNIIVSRNKKFCAAGCEIFHSLDDALHALASEKEIMIIGGANLYVQLLDRARCIYMTIVDVDFEGDVFFPTLDMKKWKLISEKKFSADEKNAYDYSFLVYENLLAL